MPLAVINSGSSSIKYRLFDAQSMHEIAGGSLDAIGTRLSRHVCRRVDEVGAIHSAEREVDAAEHRAALELVLDSLADLIDGCEDSLSIAHRVVHGGDKFQGAVRICPEVLAQLHALSALAPLHNPVNLIGIEASATRFPGAPQVAVFDTAFHRHMPPEALIYGVPREWYERHGIRRYGFHGISHNYVTHRAAELLGRPVEETNLIILHLGNGASATAVKSGLSVDNSMGMTPLAGLMMGTRCGDLDPSVLIYMMKREGLSTAQLEATLNNQSGLRGLTGKSDMREVVRNAESGDRWSTLAIDAYAYRVRKMIGAYYAVLGHVDALVFTGGVGENNVQARAACCSGIEHLGFAMDVERNRSAIGRAVEIQSEKSERRILVVPTDEELQIAREAQAVLAGTG